jgi:hypothetical protein
MDVMPSGELKDVKNLSADALVLHGQFRGIFNFQPAAHFTDAVGKMSFQDICEEWKDLPKYIVLVSSGRNVMSPGEIAGLKNQLRARIAHGYDANVSFEVWRMHSDGSPELEVAWQPNDDF